MSDPTIMAAFISGLVIGSIFWITSVMAAIWWIYASRNRERDMDDHFIPRPTPSGTVIAFRRK